MWERYVGVMDFRRERGRHNIYSTVHIYSSTKVIIWISDCVYTVEAYVKQGKGERPRRQAGGSGELIGSAGGGHATTQSTQVAGR